MIQRLALVLPLLGLAVVLGTLVVLACQPELEKPWPKSVVLPTAAPKSLITWMELDLTYGEGSAVAFSRPQREPSFQKVAWYAGYERPENLIAERTSAGNLRWGPMALDTPYEVAWRGAGEIHFRVPSNTSPSQIQEWAAELQRCEPEAVVRPIEQSQQPAPDAAQRSAAPRMAEPR